MSQISKYHRRFKFWDVAKCLKHLIFDKNPRCLMYLFLFQFNIICFPHFNLTAGSDPSNEHEFAADQQRVGHPPFFLFFFTPGHPPFFLFFFTPGHPSFSLSFPFLLLVTLLPRCCLPSLSLPVSKSFTATKVPSTPSWHSANQENYDCFKNDKIILVPYGPFPI